ncbi:unnamed protein product [Adineta ricciae]|uniref:Uncharacterized protein n=1 Tax=Adineta ricciae TaxID=249248 RepID=A0A816DX80_ADIRI|nr:unnamed protein product [Adineta ricciae]CAF1639373.1 unnamed protein product [Adineta ricciae]
MSSIGSNHKNFYTYPHSPSWFALCQQDRLIRVDIMPRFDLEKVTYQMQEKLYKDLIKTFVELIIKAIDEDNADGKISMHMAAHLAADVSDTERDGLLAIITQNNKITVII